MRRRSAEDTKWQAVKKQVRSRDGNTCRLFRVITVKQALKLKKNAGPLLGRLDAAHIYPVSQNIPMMYEVNNLVLLNRWSHSMLDSFHDPITGDPISKAEVMAWWEAIAGSRQWQALQNVKEFLYGAERSAGSEEAGRNDGDRRSVEAVQGDPS